jgi:hypothetical protein
LANGGLKQALVLRSADGQRFTQVVLGEPVNPLYSIVSVDAQTFYAAGIGAALLRSRDGGKTWRKDAGSGDLRDLEIRRRVALALALGMDVPLAWQAELAVDLGEPAIEIARRIAAVAAHPEDEETRLRVLHAQELALARDAHRKLLKRAQEEIMGLIHKGQA